MEGGPSEGPRSVSIVSHGVEHDNARWVADCWRKLTEDLEVDEYKLLDLRKLLPNPRDNHLVTKGHDARDPKTVVAIYGSPQFSNVLINLRHDILADPRIKAVKVNCKTARYRKEGGLGMGT